MKYKEKITKEIKKDRIRRNKSKIQAKSRRFYEEKKNAV